MLLLVAAGVLRDKNLQNVSSVPAVLSTTVVDNVGGDEGSRSQGQATAFLRPFVRTLAVLDLLFPIVLGIAQAGVLGFQLHSWVWLNL